MRHIARFMVAFFVLAGGQPAQAQQASEGTEAARLNAFACEALPQPLRLDVQVMDNAERYLRYRDRFVAQLQRDGIEIAGDAPNVLTLDVRKEVQFERREGGELFELRAGQENENIGRDGELFMRGNVWSNRSDSVLGGRKRDPGQLSVDQLQVTASINSRNDGRCLWRGEVLYDLDGDDQEQVTGQLMPILARALGQTVRNRPVRIDH